MAFPKVFTTLSVLTLAACGTPDDLDMPGEHAVGFTIAQRGDVPLKTWYPTADSGPAHTYPVVLKFPGFPAEPVDFPGNAQLDATPEEGPFPVVVLSHGFSLSAEWYSPMAEHLASHGFVVVAPEHDEADWAQDVVHASVARPLDVSLALDHVEDELPYADIDHVAVVGHSYGGFTALAVGGARFDLEGLAERCGPVEDPFMAGFFCTPFLEGTEQLASTRLLSDVPTGLWPSQRDDRVDAIVPIAGDAYLFGERGLADVEVPALFLGGTADTGTPWTWGAELGYANVSSDERYLVGLEGGEHMLPAISCDGMAWVDALPPEYAGYFCDDPAWSKQDAHAVLHEATTAFLLDVLTGDRRAGRVLETLEDDRILFETR